MVILTAQKVSVFGIILARIFQYSVQMRENTNQNKPETDTFHAASRFVNGIQLKIERKCY